MSSNELPAERAKSMHTIKKYGSTLGRTRSPASTLTGCVAPVADRSNRVSSGGPRTCLAEEFLRRYKNDLLAVVEELRELRRSRREGQR